jgi:hypothetical protein
MQCIGCGSTAVSERNGRTTQGYRRFRCRACGKQFDERSESLLNRTQYPSDLIALVVPWRLRWCAFPIESFFDWHHVKPIHLVKFDCGTF